MLVRKITENVIYFEYCLTKPSKRTQTLYLTELYFSLLLLLLYSTLLLLLLFLERTSLYKIQTNLHDVIF